jgi:DNA repair exonuclease SbcCD nuclease subunit
MMAEKMVEKLSSLAPFYLLIGNHDRPNNSNFLTNEHPFNAMKKWHNVHIVDVFHKLEFGGKKFLFLPYTSPGRLQEAIDIAMKTENGIEDIRSYTTIFMHQEVLGSKLGAIVSEHGDKYPLDYPLGISGHIHDYDHLQDNFIYTGTSFQQTYAESHDKKISIFTFTSENTWSQERIDLGLMKKVTVYITPEEVAGYVVPNDKMVKLVVRGNEAAIKTISKVAKIQELKKQGVKVVFKTIQQESLPSNPFTQKMAYSERLVSHISSDPHLLSWYNKIFS